MYAALITIGFVRPPARPYISKTRFQLYAVIGTPHNFSPVLKARLRLSTVTTMGVAGSKQLIEAAKRGDATEVARLLKAGAQPGVTAKDDDVPGMRALMWAATNGHIECVRALLQGGALADDKNV